MPEQQRDDPSMAEVIAAFADVVEALCDFREQVEARLSALEASRDEPQHD
jgi:hypothetical protein